MRIGATAAVAVAVLGMASMASAASILIDCGATPGTQVDSVSGKTWNGLNETTGVATPAALVWSDGSAGSVTLSYDQGKGFGSLNGSAMSPTTGAVAARGYPSFATGDSLWGLTSNGAVTLIFSGLDSATAYNLYFYSSRGPLGATDIRSADFTVTGASTSATVMYNASNNASELASFMGVAPDASGKFSVQIAPDIANDGGYFYLNASEIEVAVPEPATLSLLGLGSLSLLRRRRA